MAGTIISAEITSDLLVQIIENYRSFIFQSALKITKNYHDAEDVCQEVLLRAVKHIHGFQHRSSVKTWLFKIARNTAFNLIRRNVARPEVSLESVSPACFLDVAVAEPGAHLDLIMSLCSAQQDMTPRQQKAFELRHYQGCSFNEIARSLGTSSQNAKLISWRATRKVRAHLRKRGMIRFL